MLFALITSSLAGVPNPIWGPETEHRYVVQVRTDYAWVVHLADAKSDSARVSGLALTADLRCRTEGKAGPRTVEVRCTVADASVWATPIAGEEAHVRELVRKIETAFEASTVEMIVNDQGRLRVVEVDSKTMRGPGTEILKERLSWTLASALSPLDLLPPPLPNMEKGQGWEVKSPMSYRLPAPWPPQGNPTHLMRISEPGPSPTMRWRDTHAVSLAVSSVQQLRYEMDCKGVATWDADLKTWTLAATHVRDVKPTQDNIVMFDSFSLVRRVDADKVVTLMPSDVLEGLPSGWEGQSYSVKSAPTK